MDMAKKAIVAVIQRMSCMLSLQLEIVAGQLVYRCVELCLAFLRRKQWLAFGEPSSRRGEAQLRTKS
jgi:hypothetical protein